MAEILITLSRYVNSEKILKAISKDGPPVPATQIKLIELQLYKKAPSLEKYRDPDTLRQRLKQVGKEGKKTGKIGG